MYQEDIEQWTKVELLGHLKTMLAEEQALHFDNLDLMMPYSVDTSSVIGGIARVTRDTLPQYAIDINQKELDSGQENLYTYMYSGQITVMVGGERPSVVDFTVKRHAAVIERWINEHLTPFPDGDAIDTPYWIMGMGFVSSIFSGAMPLEQGSTDDEPSYWAAGVEINLEWRVSESGPRNVHA